ncbi:Por secretion system C-terminal sorting domain-containing protein [Chryseobacterium arachidis]|uniref:Por secretion system C-terminal sorting domain-containing protein n=1 Tax=Chryseobacterium arachidis TaxID=1416778 RepID=A0A1M4WI99_9FLAO|nr:T9SS type A sorting domain-containing protein [Chryseobacterium arachidis]SHE80880.1 Por secretion system C-terminal sorting domain-containing protein [Chryseobacterium arachidis]
MKSTTILLICSLIISTFSNAQTSTELFETESVGSTTFTDNGVIFNIISSVATYDIFNFAGGGWSGTAPDNRFIDNTGTATSQYANSSLTIKTTSNLFKVNRFWVYLTDRLSSLAAPGTLTVTGKLSGVTKFTQIKTTGFTTSLSVTNGFTLIDLTNLNGQNYSNIVIDELVLTIGGDFRYMVFDAFTWVKDSNLVLAANEVKPSVKESAVYPNPTTGPLTIKSADKAKFEIYSQSGQLLKTVEAQKGVNETDISELPKGVYIVKSSSESYKIIKK